jgi:hypothetical protein
MNRDSAHHDRNVDDRTVAGFGAEWTRFDQSGADLGVNRSAFG